MKPRTAVAYVDWLIWFVVRAIVLIATSGWVCVYTHVCVGRLMSFGADSTEIADETATPLADHVCVSLCSNNNSSQYANALTHTYTYMHSQTHTHAYCVLLSWKFSAFVSWTASRLLYGNLLHERRRYGKCSWFKRTLGSNVMWARKLMSWNAAYAAEIACWHKYSWWLLLFICIRVLTDDCIGLYDVCMDVCVCMDVDMCALYFLR